MNNNFLKLLKQAIIFFLASTVVIIFYVKFFDHIAMLAYRLVAIFLSLVLISNLAAKLLTYYFRLKKE